MLLVKNLKVSLKDSDKTIFGNINFELKPNKIYTILGKNGVGKSVLLRSLTRLSDPNIFDVAGEVIFNNSDLLSIPEAELRSIRKSRIRYVFQDESNSFNPLKKFEYYFRAYTKAGTDDIRKLFSELLLHPYEKFLGSYPYEVSIGQIQRIGFALSLLSDPDFLILDEPTSAIDPINGNLFMNKLKEFVKHENKFVLLVTHNTIFARKVSHAVALFTDVGLTEFTEPGSAIAKFISMNNMGETILHDKI